MHVSKAMGKRRRYVYTIRITIGTLTAATFFLGQQMEEKGIEWVCPNCTKKKGEEVPTKVNAQTVSGKQRIRSDTVTNNAIGSKGLASPSQTSVSGETSSSLIPTASDYGDVQYSSSTQCVVCKKEARNSSIYCSDACILAHAQETLTKDKPLPGSTTASKGMKSAAFDSTSRPKPEARVIVFERKTGRVLTGECAIRRSGKKIRSCVCFSRANFGI